MNTQLTQPGTTNWKQLVQKFTDVKVLIVGDVMLDKYWFGDTSRISPEAPVPIAKIEMTDLRAGGAANVARNIASLNGQASLLAITGNDYTASELESILRTENINTSFVKDPSIDTTIKLRVIARNQQLIRIDFENSPNINSVLQLKSRFEQSIKEYDIVILSDYDKGSLQHVAELIQIANAHNIPILVDPKGSDYTKYQYANMLTPNRQELRAVVGMWDNENELTEKAQKIRKYLNIDSLLLTRSEEGLSLYQEDRVVHQSTVAKEVFDVSGAGDTVIAVAALSLSSNLDNQQLMKIANTAAGIVVAKVGTATCSSQELIEKLT
ncbi:MAG: D-glycero-beta-D-manno-heptose-7-phosphate kinase [Neisseriaceae bacterium]|nr:MAG: D-glycero-beta-D-manno-heptose-7-phosphate kinase [Neisseriaceae bacterium]